MVQKSNRILIAFLFSLFFQSCLKKKENSLMYLFPVGSSSKGTQSAEIYLPSQAISVNEGGSSGSYTITLNREPSSDVIIDLVAGSEIQFSNGSSNLQLVFPMGGVLEQTVFISAVDDNKKEGTHSDTITHSVSGDPSFSALSLSDVSVTITDNDTPSVLISETDGNTLVSEAGATDSYSIVLSTIPSSDVIIQFTSGSELNPIANLTFTPSNWNTVQIVNVSAVDDSVAEGLQTVSISHSASSSDTDYNGIAINDVNMSIQDNDGIILTATDTTATEGGPTGQLSYVLTQAPSSDVTITFSHDSNVSLSSTILTFSSSNWNTPQTITITAVDDNVYEGPHTSTVTHITSSSDSIFHAVNAGDFTLNITDNDTAAIVVVESGGITNTMEGFGNDSVSYTLSSKPSSDVVLNLNFDSSQITLNGSSSGLLSLTFTSANWNTAQNVTVAAVADGVIESATHTSNITYSVSSSDTNYNGYSLTETAVSVIEDHGVYLLDSFQTDSLNISSANTTKPLSTTVNPLTSFVSCNFLYSSSDNRNAATCQLSSDGSAVEIKTGGLTNVRVNYYVVEFDSGTIVQRGVSSFANGNSTRTVSLASNVDLSRTMVIAYSRTTEGDFGNDERRSVKAVLTDSSTLTLSRLESGSAVDVEYQVVMMSTSSVQSGQVTINAGSTFATAIISSVDLDSSFLMFNYTGSATINGQERYLYTRGDFTNETTIQFNRNASVGSVEISYFAVTLSTGLESIQRDITTVTNTTANHALSTTVDLSRSLVILTNETSGSNNSSQDSGTYWVDTASTNSQLVFRRQNDEGNTGILNWTVVEFSP